MRKTGHSETVIDLSDSAPSTSPQASQASQATQEALLTRDVPSVVPKVEKVELAPTPLVKPEEKEEPNEFLCPITKDIMQDPVILIDISKPDNSTGHSYEKEAIKRCLEASGKNPLTNQPIAKYILMPNINLREAISRYTGVKPVISGSVIIGPVISEPVISGNENTIWSPAVQTTPVSGLEERKLELYPLEIRTRVDVTLEAGEIKRRVDAVPGILRELKKYAGGNGIFAVLEPEKDKKCAKRLIPYLHGQLTALPSKSFNERVDILEDLYKNLKANKPKTGWFSDILTSVLVEIFKFYPTESRDLGDITTSTMAPRG